MNADKNKTSGRKKRERHKKLSLLGQTQIEVVFVPFASFVFFAD